jgi:hypothetical protein
MLPSLIETRVTLSGAETAGFAVPINFLLQPESIAELLKESGAKFWAGSARTLNSISGKKLCNSGTRYLI